jgi:isopentenyl phosphate kinase
MQELVFLKLGGSLLTDKTQEKALRAAVLARLAAEVAAALVDQPGLRLLIGHGSGSFGHVTASRHQTRAGVRSSEGWRGYADTALVAGELNRLVVDALRQAGVPVLPLQPSASAYCHDGELRSLEERPVRVALEHGLVPVLYGDVALDEVRGGTIISTEEILAWLAARLCPARVILAGEMPGVLGFDPHGIPADSPELAKAVISQITPLELEELAHILGDSRGVDVTGGMLSKVRAMVGLLQTVPALHRVQLVSGLELGLVRSVLVDANLRPGTTIQRFAEG